MRSGTSSASVKFQISFCRATQARSSAKPPQLRITIVSALTIAAPVAWLAATEIQVHPSQHSQCRFCFRADAAPSTQIVGGTCDWFCAAPIRDQSRDTARYLPAQKTDRRPLLPAAIEDPRK